MVSAWILERRRLHGAEFRTCLTDWLIREQNQPQSIVDSCLLLLEESNLLSLPLPPRVVLPALPGPRNFRFLFRRHVASLLGWTERREEGEFHGFSDSVNKFVREVWWPDEGAEALHSGRQGNRVSSGIPGPEVPPPVVDVLTQSVIAEELRRVEAPDPIPRSAPRGSSRSRPVRPQTNSGGGSGSTIGAEAALDQQLLLRSSDFPAGRLVRQRLELGAGGSILLHQSVEGLVHPMASMEGTSEAAPHENTSPTRVVKKKPVKKRRSASSSGR